MGGDAAEEGYTFMMSPTEPIQQMEGQYAPIGGYLSEELDREVELQYAADYSAINRSLDSGTGHMAEMGPIAAALGASNGSAEVVLQRRGFGDWTYSSVIVTREDSDIESLEDLEGGEVAFADMLSASGSIYPLNMLKDAGLEIGSSPRSESGADFGATWSGHDTAFESMMAGQADAAGVGLFIATDDDYEYKEGVREVDRRDGLPRAPIVVSPELDEATKEDFVEAFVNAPEEVYLGESGEEGTDDDLWFDAVREADVETYRPTIEAAENVGVSIDLLNEQTETES